MPELLAQWQRETRTGLALLPFTYRVDWYIETGWKLEEIVTCDEFVLWDDLASIVSLSRLQRLALPSAKLGDLGARAIAENLINLHFLLLGDNRLTDDALRRLVEGLPLLETIRVQGNESLRLPQELMGTTNAAGLRDYFRRAQSEGKRKLNESELIVVGNEAVGKTALVNYLIKDEPCSDTDKTPGLHIQERIEVTPWDTHHTTRDPKEDQDGGKGIVELRQTIIDTIRREIPQASVEFPLSYFEVKERLREIAEAEHSFDLVRFTNICRDVAHPLAGCNTRWMRDHRRSTISYPTSHLIKGSVSFDDRFETAHPSPNRFEQGGSCNFLSM